MVLAEGEISTIYCYRHEESRTSLTTSFSARHNMISTEYEQLSSEALEAARICANKVYANAPDCRGKRASCQDCRKRKGSTCACVSALALTALSASVPLDLRCMYALYFPCVYGSVSLAYTSGLHANFHQTRCRPAQALDRSQTGMACGLMGSPTGPLPASNIGRIFAGYSDA